MLTDDEMREWLARIKKMPRKHASYFQYPEKATIEIGVVHDFYAQLEEETGERLIGSRLGSDPPDLVVETTENGEIGVEVTELVNEKAIDYQIRKDARYVNALLSWDESATRARIEERIRTKEAKITGDFARCGRKVLLMFTDEPHLRAEDCERYVQDYEFEDVRNFDEVWLIFGYDPGTQRQPIVRLHPK